MKPLCNKTLGVVFLMVVLTGLACGGGAMPTPLHAIRVTVTEVTNMPLPPSAAPEMLTRVAAETPTPLGATPQATLAPSPASTRTLAPAPTLETPATSTLAPTYTPTLNPYTGPVKIFGHVTDENGKPLVTNVAFDAFGLGDQGFVATSSSGYYEKQVPDALQYIVSVNPGPAKQVGKYSFPTGILSQRRLVVRNGPEAQVDFTIGAGGTLWLQAYDKSGNEMTPGDYVNSSMIGAYPLGAYPEGATYQNAYGGYSVFWGWIQGSNQNVACLLLPPSKPAELWAAWRVPGIGTTFLHADNDGQGFSVETGAVAPVNLVYEFARTEYRDTLKQFQDRQTAGYRFTADISACLAAAGRSLTLAENLHQSGSEAASARQAYLVLTNVVQAREQFTLEQAQQDIETNRMGSVTVTLTDDQGHPLPNVKVSYRQVSHDFVFSIAFPSEAQYPALRAAGFEYASFESWWGEIETSDGTYKFPDAQIAQLQKAGFGIVMHAGVWTTPAYQPATPLFLAYASPATVIAQAGQYSQDILNHFKNQIKVYNAFNEPDQLQAYPFTLNELVNLVGSSLQGAKKADPGASDYVNLSMPIFEFINQGGANYTVAYDMYGHAKPGSASFASPAASGTEFVQALRATAYNPDAIGLEYYYGVVLPPIDLGLYADSLDHYGSLSKKVFISELSYATLDDYPGLNKWWSWYGGWHGGYTDQAQAEWAKDALTIAFGKPFVNGVQWTGASDGPTDYDFVGDGLFHSDGVTPRPALRAMGDAIQSWTTQGTATTDAAGSLALRGFGGDYALTITTTDGRTLHSRVHVTEQEHNQTSLTLDATPPTIQSASASSQGVKNGENLEIKVSADGTAAAVSADVSRLDTTQKDPLVLAQGADGIFSGDLSVSVVNSASNGIKTIPITVADAVGNVSTTTLQIELNNPAPTLDPAPPDDTFYGVVLDTVKWRPQINGNGTVKQDGRLILSVANAPANSNVTVQSTWAFTGDFDVQVDFQIGPGWSKPAQEHLDGAMLGVNISGQTYHITRLRSGNQDVFFAWSNQGTLTRNMSTTAVAGKYRLVRIGTNLVLLCNSGAGWRELDSVAVPAGPAQVYLGNGSVNAAQAFTTYFDNFQINSGLTTYRP
jgi:endo-1,4-beta-xylanase